MGSVLRIHYPSKPVAREGWEGDTFGGWDWRRDTYLTLGEHQICTYWSIWLQFGTSITIYLKLVCMRVQCTSLQCGVIPAKEKKAYVTLKNEFRAKNYIVDVREIEFRNLLLGSTKYNYCLRSSRNFRRIKGKMYVMEPTNCLLQL